MKTGYDVIISPIITENTMDMAADKKYAFKVARTPTRLRSVRLSRRSSE